MLDQTKKTGAQVDDGRLACWLIAVLAEGLTEANMEC